MPQKMDVLGTTVTWKGQKLKGRLPREEKQNKSRGKPDKLGPLLGSKEEIDTPSTMDGAEDGQARCRRPQGLSFVYSVSCSAKQKALPLFLRGFRERNLTFRLE